MKRHYINYFLLVTVLFCITSTSCTKKSNSSTPSYTCAACKTTPDAVAAYDNSSKGVYKGTVVGSSGTVKFNIGNNDSTITATMIIDGTTVALTASVAWVAGSSYVSPFTGTMNGQTVTIKFSVGSDGSDPNVLSADIPGHPGAVLTVSKETSANLIMIFEGTYSGNNDHGTFDLFLSKTLKKWTLTSESVVDSSNKGQLGGTYDDSNSTLNYTDNSGGVVKGTLTGDQINGTYNGSGNTGTWTAKRTL